MSLLLYKCFNPRITRWLFLIFWIYALWLVWMNLTPGSTEKLEMKIIVFVRMDYFYHCMAYIILSGLYIAASFSPRPVFRKYAIALGIVLMILIATVPEWMQNFVQNRRFNWWDMLANFTGLAIGTGAGLIFFRIFPVENNA
jgi:VanZ family protein